MDIIKVEELTKVYKDGKNEKYALDNISFSIKRGEICSILGHNGAGKTTLFLILSTLLNSTNGRIRILGHELDSHKNIKYIRRNIGLFTDDLNIYPYLTVQETLHFFSEINRAKLNDIEEWIEVLDLRQYKKYRISALSTGLKKRVSLLLSIITNPKLLLLDEPFSALDPESTELLKDFLNYLIDKNTTILISSHDLYQVQQVANKGIILKQGKLIEQGNFEDLNKKYSIEDKYVITVNNNSLIKNICYQFNLDLNKGKIICDKNQFEILIKEIIRNDLEYQDIETIKPSLEELYLKLNKGI